MSLLQLFIVVISAWVLKVLYNLYLSPLRHIPSPLVFQVVPFYYRYLRAQGSAHLVVHQLHLVYGPVFRVEPNAVVFVDKAEAAQFLYGSYQCPKAKVYEGFSYFGESLLSARAREVHAPRKRLIAPAFTRNKIEEMEPVIIEFGVNRLVANFKAAAESNRPIDTYKQAHYMSWDIIGALVFGQSFDMLINGKHEIVGWAEKVSGWGLVCHALPVLKNFRFAPAERVREFTDKLMVRHYLNPAKSSVILNQITKPDSGLNKDEVFSEAVLMLHAGTDTVASSLTWLFYLLIINSDWQEKVRRELRETFAPDSCITWKQCMAHAPILIACIKETLRLLPPTPGTPPRYIDKPQGETLLGYHLPQNTECAVSIYSLNRSPRLWDKPETFLPERWLDEKEERKNRVKFMPFLMGPHACIGKDLAWMELLVVGANVLLRYKLTMPDPNIPVPIVARPISRPKSGQLLINVELVA